MARALNDDFFEWLKKDPLNILETISQYDCLAIHFSDGKALKVYFKGFLILTVTHSAVKRNDANYKTLSKSYYEHKPNNARLLDIIKTGVNHNNLQEYLDCVIGFLSRRNNTRYEEAVRQEIGRVNNRSREANDTDFFIVDEEYKVGEPKFDLVAVKWLSDENVRKHFSSGTKGLEIVVFELKQGLKAVGGSRKATTEQADLKKHISDFNAFIANPILLEYKRDIIKMFVQQAALKGFFNKKVIKGLKHVEALSPKEIEKIAENIPVKFGLIISDYKQESKRLKEQFELMEGDFIFATASFMGYGLYEKSMLTKEQIKNILI